MTTEQHNKEQEQFKRNERIIEREVYACVTPMVDYILNAAQCGEIIHTEAPFSNDDIENLYSLTDCEACGQTYDKHDEATYWTCPDGEDSFQGVPQTVYEWWAVSPWLYEELKAQGEPVIDTFPHLWGRTCSGQAIALDGVITRIEQKLRKWVEE
jgi:hypothetical protein